MSQKRHSMHQHRLAGVKVNSGRFQCNGQADPLEVEGSGFTVTYSATDQYKVTFDGPYRTILSVNLTVEGSPAAIVSHEYMVDGASDAASFLVNYITQDGTSKLFDVTDLPAALDDVWIHFHVTFLDIGAQ